MQKLTFQVIRRTIATLGQKKSHVKDMQGILRQAKAPTTIDIYKQSLEPEVRSTLDWIRSELMGTGTNGPVPRKARAAISLKASKRSDRCDRRVNDGFASPQHVHNVVLEFATRMRQNRGREELLND
jgi:hypothetical protein